MKTYKQAESGGGDKIRTWPKVKKQLNKKFLPKDYEQELFFKLTKLRQGSMTVEEYIREFERLTLLCDLQERTSQITARFVHGLNLNLQDI